LAINQPVGPLKAHTCYKNPIIFENSKVPKISNGPKKWLNVTGGFAVFMAVSAALIYSEKTG
jgi:hypothetical protein